MLEDFNYMAYIVMPFLIFLSRIVDVSIGTIRVVFISRGFRILAPILGFFEVFIWITAIATIMDNLSNIVAYIAYAGGFAMGNYVGMLIEEKLSLGLVAVRIITVKKANELIDYFRVNDYGVTDVEATGINGKVNIIYTIIKRSCLRKVTEAVLTFNPDAFYSVEEVKAVKGIFPHSKGTYILETKRKKRFSLRKSK